MEGNHSDEASPESSKDSHVPAGRSATGRKVGKSAKNTKPKSLKASSQPDDVEPGALNQTYDLDVPASSGTPEVQDIAGAGGSPESATQTNKEEGDLFPDLVPKKQKTDAKKTYSRGPGKKLKAATVTEYSADDDSIPEHKVKVSTTRGRKQKTDSGNDNADEARFHDNIKETSDEETKTARTEEPSSPDPKNEGKKPGNRGKKLKAGVSRDRSPKDGRKGLASKPGSTEELDSYPVEERKKTASDEHDEDPQAAVSKPGPSALKVEAPKLLTRGRKAKAAVPRDISPEDPAAPEGDAGDEKRELAGPKTEVPKPMKRNRKPKAAISREASPDDTRNEAATSGHPFLDKASGGGPEQATTVEDAEDGHAEPRPEVLKPTKRGRRPKVAVSREASPEPKNDEAAPSGQLSGVKEAVDEVKQSACVEDVEDEKRDFQDPKAEVPKPVKRGRKPKATVSREASPVGSKKAGSPRSNENDSSDELKQAAAAEDEETSQKPESPVLKAQAPKPVKRGRKPKTTVSPRKSPEDTKKATDESRATSPGFQPAAEPGETAPEGRQLRSRKAQASAPANVLGGNKVPRGSRKQN